MKLRGRNAIVTGASLGIGRAIAETFVREGADLLLCARNERALADAAQEMRKISSPGQKILWKTADVSSEEDVKELAAFADRELGTCAILVNNAGVQGPIGKMHEVGWGEWKRTLEIDLYGGVLVSRAIIPQMISQRAGKIINLSGGGATGPRPGFSAYAAAKAAVVRVTETLAEELREFGIDVNSLAPGRVLTRLTAGAMAEGGDEIKSEPIQAVQRDDTADAAVDLCVFLASSESDGITGRLISARWDDWRNLVTKSDELAASDIYTLRRIVPEDRGKTWGKSA